MKTRIIKTGIYSHEIMLSLTPDVRSVCAYLYSNAHISLTDIYKIPPQIIQLETGYDISTIKIILDKLQDVGVLKHYKYLWVQLLREDFASLVYSGKKNDNAKEKYELEIPLYVIDYFQSDTSIDTSMYTSYKSEIINKKSKIRNHKPDSRVNEIDYKDTQFKDNTIKVSEAIAPQISELIKLFEEVNPNCKTMYGNKTQRSACEYLIEEYTFEVVSNVIKHLSKTNVIPYFPHISTPDELKKKWTKLEDAFQRYKLEKKKKETIVAF